MAGEAALGEPEVHGHSRHDDTKQEDFSEDGPALVP